MGKFYAVNTTLPMFDATSSPPSLQTSRGVIKIADAQGAQPQGAQVSFVELRAGTANGFTPTAVSAAVNLELVYRYYLDRFQRNSIDGRGGSILGVVNVNMNNAFWNGSYIALGSVDTWAGSLDFNAHEMTHGVISSTSNLVYQDQSGSAQPKHLQTYLARAVRRTSRTEISTGFSARVCRRDSDR